MLERSKVYDMLTKEDEYAQKWAKGGRKESTYDDATTGLPFSLADWIIFTEKYIDEARLALANYTPDQGAVRIRLIKAASLLVSALQVHGKEDDLERLAGVSSSKFPILHGGLATFDALTDQSGKLNKDIANLRSEEKRNFS